MLLLFNHLKLLTAKRLHWVRQRRLHTLKTNRQKLNTPTTMTLTPESIKGMSASLLADAILGTCEAIRVELKAAHGGERFNQAAARRARKAGRQLEILCKAYRKASVK